MIVCDINLQVTSLYYLMIFNNFVTTGKLKKNFFEENSKFLNIGGEVAKNSKFSTK